MPTNERQANFYWFKWLKNQKSSNPIVAICASPNDISKIKDLDLGRALLKDIGTKLAFVFEYRNELRDKNLVDVSKLDDLKKYELVKNQINSEKDALNNYLTRLSKQITSGYEDKGWWGYALSWAVSCDDACTNVEEALMQAFNCVDKEYARLSDLYDVTQDQISTASQKFSQKYASYNPVTKYAVRLYFDTAIAYARLCALEHVLWHKD